MLKTFMDVNLESFIPDTTTGLDIYIRRGTDFLLYRKGELPFTVDNQRKLLEGGHRTVYIASEDREKYLHYMESNIGRIVADPRFPMEKKTRIVYETSTAIMEGLFSDPRSTDKIQRSKNVIQGTVDLILSGPEAAHHLMSLTAHDYYTYSHSVNVTIFGVALAARVFGQDSEHNFHRLGHGFLLHDLGKSLIDVAIINKPGKLNEQEWTQMKKHPEIGYELLQESGEISEEIRIIILEHHERYCGGGYPLGLAGEKIHPYGRLCAIADVFDALSTKRTYREAMSSYDALKLMRDKMSEHFDPDYFREFVLLFQEEALERRFSPSPDRPPVSGTALETGRKTSPEDARPASD